MSTFRIDRLSVKRQLLLAGLLWLGILRVDVHAQNPIKIGGGNVAMTISTGLPGQEPTPVVNTATKLTYRRESFVTKVTVQSSCTGQDFTLKVLAINVTGGTAAPEVTLTNGMLAADFITNIPVKPPATSSCTLQYTASATFAQGNSTEVGNDVHTVTYTILAK